MRLPGQYSPTGVFARENLHPNDVTVKKWSDRENPNAETYDVSGGWYDAVHPKTGKRKARIEPVTCVGCGVCSQICPVQAISGPENA